MADHDLIEETISRRGSPRALLFIIVSLLLIGSTLYVAPDQLEHWHYILQRALYLPIIVAGLTYGWKSGGVVAVLVSIVYLLRHNPLTSADVVDLYLEALTFCLLGILSGVLSDRERRQRRGLEESTRALQQVYQELQANVEQLKRAARMSALGHLSAGLAHEIRNPLASIEGAAYIAQTESEEGKRTEFLEIIRKETKRLNGLLSHFLEFARPQAPQMVVIDARTLSESVLTLVGRTINQNTIKLTTRFESDMLPIQCDPEQMKQVLLNLVLNAIQAMPSGGEVSVSGSQEANEVVLRVTDSGTGIDPDKIEQIFDPFFTTKETGTGLGLPVAYQIVEQHKGVLSLEASSPQGCCFAIRLPATRNVRL